MTSITAAILILGATATAERSMETTASIERIIFNVVKGAVSDAIGSGSEEQSGTGWDRLAGLVQKKELPIEGLRLRIDGTERSGWRAWAEAAIRVIGYAIDRRNTGSVCYSYGVRVRGYDVRRETRIEDGRILLTTSTGWTETVQIGRLSRRIPIHVTIRITATESGVSTLLVGSAVGRGDCSDFRCRLVRAIAERTAEGELESGLDRSLVGIRDAGIDWYTAGASGLDDVLDQLRAGIELGRRLRR